MRPLAMVRDEQNITLDRAASKKDVHTRRFKVARQQYTPPLVTQQQDNTSGVVLLFTAYFLVAVFWAAGVKNLDSAVVGVVDIGIVVGRKGKVQPVTCL